MSNRSISVVMVTYWTGPVLFAALASLLQQPEVASFILVDNGNDEDTRQRLRALASEDPRLVIVAGHGNIGFAAACNKGAALADGEYLLLVNPDCVVPPDCVAVLAKQIESEPRAWVLAPALVGPDGQRQRGTPRNILTPWIAVVEALRLDRLAPNHPYFRRLNLHEAMSYREPTAVPAASGAFLFMPRRVYAELGGMDEAYFLHVEDLDFCVRLSRAGGQLMFLPQVSVLHYESTSRKPTPFVEWHKARGFHRYFNRHFAAQYPASFLWLATSLAYAQFAIRSVRWLLSPWRWTGRAALPSAILGLPPPSARS